jgi:hypothetical protein
VDSAKELQYTLQSVTKLSKTLILAAFLWVLLGISEARAQILSPTSTEILFSYETDFEAAPDSFFSISAEELALNHANYLFGVMASIELANSFGIDSTLVQGLGAPRADMQIQVVSAEMKSGKLILKYKNQGRMLVHNQVAEKILKDRSWSLPLPVDENRAYIVHCTDHRYFSMGDYWYFWNPYRLGCESLLKAPLVKFVSINISPVRQKKFDEWTRLDLLRGANGNGPLFSIYAVHGFDEGPEAKNDGGRLAYDTFNKYLLSLGFKETVKYSGLSRPLKVYQKSVVIPPGKLVEVEIKSLLADTSLEIKGITFAKFFKEAVESADVIYYSGHSGLGGNLSIPDLENKVGGFVFPQNKRQLFYFEACSSYSYYLTPFKNEKTRAKIDILTNGLASYFETANIVLHGFIDVLLSEKQTDILWIDFIKQIEKPLDGQSYLLNVGGV